MTTSTRICAIGLAILIGMATVPTAATATDGRPVFGIAPLAHSLPHVRSSLAGVLSQEIGLSGRFKLADSRVVAKLLQGDPELDLDEITPEDYPFLTASELSRFTGVCDYLLVGEVLALDIASRDDRLEFSEDFSEVGRILGASSRIAQARFSLRVLRVADGAESASFLVEGLESRKGEQLSYASLGWLGSIDFSGEEFRGTNLGQATYKAIGEVVRALAGYFPLVGSVLAVSEDAIVIDLGPESGLRLGDELLILQPQSIANDAGVVVWSTELRVGSAQVVEFQGGHCLGMILDGWGDIREGNLVRPVDERLIVPVESDPVD